MRAFDWPLAAALRCYRFILRRDEVEAWRHEHLLWTLRTPYLPKGSKERAPEPPAWLRALETPRVIRA